MSRKTRTPIAIAFIAPAFLVYTLAVIYPLVSTLWSSFFSWQGIVSGDFVGLANFNRLFGNVYLGTVLAAFWHNVYWFVGIMVIQNVGALLIAYLLFTRRRQLGSFTSGMFQSIFFLPAILSPVLVGALWRLLLAPTGPLDSLLVALHIANGPVPFLGDPTIALPILISVDAWNWLGFPLLVYLAGFNDIPPEIIEAATLDGAGSWRILRSIGLPLIVPALGTITILTFIGAFNQFDTVYIMEGLQGSPNYSTDVLGTFFYRLAFGTMTNAGVTDIGVALAVATLLLIFLSAGTVIGLRLVMRRIVQF
ncbi:MAG: sugar ABC transporter permease [Candidatus Limnocylindrales bacterium]|jgi:raffinose/stachyose/melibiose transport system permease protein